jgi:hypothetical protein
MPRGRQYCRVAQSLTYWFSLWSYPNVFTIVRTSGASISFKTNKNRLQGRKNVTSPMCANACMTLFDVLRPKTQCNHEYAVVRVHSNHGWVHGSLYPFHRYQIRWRCAKTWIIEHCYQCSDHKAGKSDPTRHSSLDRSRYGVLRARPGRQRLPLAF